ncbi:hypothetical protein AAHE18_20G094900 [Arachis hypogaea]
MEFKDLKAFNLAMLAKQGWRLMTKPHSLFYKIFKNKYFRYSSYLEAKPGNRPSSTWQSLLEGRKILEKGVKCKVSIQGSVRIREDPWFGNQPPFRIAVNECRDESLTWVRQLITVEGEWNQQLLMEAFPLDTAQQIQQIPITEEEDSIIWCNNNSGEYSVKSGYSIAYQFFHPRVNSLHPRYADSEMWKTLWKMRVTPKVKLFAWRLAHEGIAVKAKLNEKLTHVSSLCPHCWRHRCMPLSSAQKFFKFGIAPSS